MAMAGIENGARYLQVLREDSGERELLAKDLLINVTHFFRDPAAFDLLGETNHSGTRAAANTGSTSAHLGARLQHG